MTVRGSASPKSRVKGPIRIWAVCQPVLCTWFKEQINPGWIQGRHVEE